MTSIHHVGYSTGSSNVDSLAWLSDVFTTIPFYKGSPQQSKAPVVAKDTEVIEGAITELLWPETKEEFRGWAKVVIAGRYVLCGNIPAIDNYYHYRFVCTRLSTYQKQQQAKRAKSRPRHVHYSRWDIARTILYVDAISRRKFSRQLLINMLQTDLHMPSLTIHHELGQLDSQMAIMRRVSRPSNGEVLSKLMEFSWFNQLCQSTSYFFGPDIIFLAEAYGHKRLVKLLRLSPVDFNKLAIVAKRNPQYLCTRATCPLIADQVGELKIRGLKLCASKFQLSSTVNPALPAIFCYENDLKPRLKVEGHTYLSSEMLEYLCKSKAARKYLISNKIIIQDPNDDRRYFMAQSVMHRNIIVAFLKKVFQRAPESFQDANTFGAEYDVARNISEESQENDDDGESDDEFDLFIDRLKSRKRGRGGGGGKRPKKRRKRRQCPEVNLDIHQLLAVEQSFTVPLLFITGKPGRGKTQTLQQIVDNHEKGTYLMVAPTGMAASRMAHLSGVHCYTIDMAIIELKRGKIDKRKISGVIVDECSMVNEKHLAELFTLLRGGGCCIRQLIMVGDDDQVLPIGFGRPFRDMLRKYHEQVVRLTINHRVDPRFVVLSQVWDCILAKNPNIPCVYGDRHIGDASKACVLVERQAGVSNWENVLRVIQALPEEDRGKFQLLTHRNESCREINKGYFKRTNARHAQWLEENQQQKTYNRPMFVKGQKVIFVKNNYGPTQEKSGIFSDPVSNGEIDHIARIIDYIPDPKLKKTERDELNVEEVEHTLSERPKHGKGWRRALVMRRSKKMVDLSTIGWHTVQSAAGITGNKGQGSQYEVVIVLIDAMVAPDGTTKVSRHFSRVLLYVMASRATRKLIIICKYNDGGRTVNGELGQIILNHDEEERFSDLYSFLPDYE